MTQNSNAPLNYKHLHYFWTAVREGGVGKAADRLGLSPQTVSEQIGLLEQALGRSLFRPQGRKLVPTEAGQIAAQFADQIFLLGEQLRQTLEDPTLNDVVRLSVGIADAMPKGLAYRLVKTALDAEKPPRLSCYEGEFDELLADLALHKLDLVLTDRPYSGGGNLKVYNHFLGACNIGFFGRDPHAGKGLDESALSGLPLLLPARTNALRQRLDTWFGVRAIRANVVAEFEDSALMLTVARSGHGICPAPRVLADEMREEYGLHLLLALPDVTEQFYAITHERRIQHPGVDLVLGNAAQHFADND